MESGRDLLPGGAMVLESIHIPRTGIDSWLKAITAKNW